MRLLTGAIPTPRHLLAAATPHVPVGATPPQFIIVPKQLDMWGNATFGDCVTAEEAFAKACYTPEIFIPAAKVIKWARRNWALNGAGLWEILTLMQKNGFDQGSDAYLDGPFKSVDWADAALLKNAIFQGPVKIGVQADELQNVPNIGVSNGWVATGFTGGNPEDHCTSLCGYGTFGYLATQLGVTVDERYRGHTGLCIVHLEYDRDDR